MPFTDPDRLPRRRSDDELLDHIYAEGARRQLQCRRVGGVGIAAALLTLIASAALVARSPGGSPEDQFVATEGGTATSATAPTTTLSPPALPATTWAPPPPPTVPPSSTPSRPTTTAEPATTAPPTTLVCHNSTDAACGPFRWEPEPGPNAPLVIEVAVTPRRDQPRTIDFAVVYTDADATIDEACRIVSYGDDQSSLVTGGVPGCVQFACLAPYGPWAPPPREAGRSEATVSHIYSGPGTYTVRFTARSDHGCFEPYQSYGEKTVTVVVP